MAIPPTKLTEAFIRGLTCEDKPFLVRDTTIKGLMIAVNKHSKSFKVQRDLWVGQRGRRRKVKTVRHTLGTTLELTLDDARTRAMEVIAQIKQGMDPNAPAGATSRAEMWTVEQMFEEYAEDLRTRECADRTITDLLAQRDRYFVDWNAVPISEMIWKRLCQPPFLFGSRGAQLPTIHQTDIRVLVNAFTCVRPELPLSKVAS